MSNHLRAVSRVAEATDESLLALANAGDEDAFAQIYLRYARYVAAVVVRLFGDSSELDDTVQETFVAAALGLSKLKEPEKLRAWLVAIAVRKVQRRLGMRMRRRWIGAQLTVSRTVSDPRSRGLVDELYDVLEHVPDKVRVPWLLVRVEGMSLEEAAGACDLSLSTLKRRLAEGDERIQRKLHAE